MAVSMTMPILVVDDYNTMLRILRNLLRQIGFTNIDEASDGPDALSKLRERPYSLVISDWNMSPMSGADLLSTLRADERTRNTPFLMVAAGGHGESVAQNAGADSYIVKPFNAQALKKKLVAVLGDF